MPYAADRYLDFDEVHEALRGLVEACPSHVCLETIGHSRGGRPLLVVTIGDRRSGDPDERPTLWLDGGTHAVEWTGVMSAVRTLSRWVQGLVDGDDDLRRWFARHTVVAAPCVSPDGLHETVHGAPGFRSTLRPPRPGTVRTGFEAHDIDGDGHVRWMRWRDPAGSWVPVDDNPIAMRPRTMDDDPDDAWFMAEEGQFLQWDGVRWHRAPLRHGLDLNRNFPVDWEPFSMFGMDAGAYPGSEPESRALLDAVSARPNIVAAVTNHTYTGCLLTPPARKDSPLPGGDLSLMKRLGRDLVEGTGYRVFPVYPEFMYDPDKPIIGTWDDTLSAVFGICAYTLELWDPFAWAGLDHADPVAMFRDPDPERVRAVLDQCVADGAYRPWTDFEHPQLGAVQLGGIDYQRTVRNPPEALLAAECDKGHAVADRLRRCLPDVHGRVETERLGDHTRVRLVLENHGALSTCGLQRAVDIGAAPPVTAEVHGAEVLDGSPTRELHHLAGWMRAGFARNPVYPNLDARGHRAVAEWVVRGTPSGEVRWRAGRAGTGVAPIEP